MDDIDIIEYKKPTYKLYVEIKNKDLYIKKVLCHLYLPKRYKDLVVVQCHPTLEQYKKLNNIFDFSISGWVKYDNNTKSKKIVANEGYFAGSKKIQWGSKIYDCILNTRIMELTVTENYERDLSEKELNTINCQFWITPCHILTPFDKTQNISFKIFNNRKLQFTTYNKDIDDKNVQELFAEYEIEDNSFDMKEELRHINNFLLIVSLAMREPCFCIGWTTYESKIITEYYRNSVSRDLIKDDPYSSNELIDYSNFNEFIDVVYNKYENVKNKNLIRHVIYALAYGQSSTIEDSFKALFTAVETLIIYFQKEMDSGPKIMNDTEWAKFKCELEKFIKYESLISGSDNKQKAKRKLVYDKLNALKTISFNESIIRFCNFYNVDITDLWPLSSNKNGYSLREIRNILVHGDTIDNSQYIALMNASNHLQWIAERLLLGIFGWPLEKSNVNKDILS